VARRPEKPTANEEADDRDAVGVEIPVPDRRGAAGVVFEHSRIYVEPDERQTEQTHTDVTKAAIRHDTKQPDQGEAFERPAERDPFTIELDRKDQRDEEERGRALPREARTAGSGIRLTFPDEKQNRNRVGNDESSGSEAVSQSRKCLCDCVVDERELERAGERADLPRQRLP